MTDIPSDRSSSGAPSLYAALHKDEITTPASGPDTIRSPPCSSPIILSKLRAYLRYRETVRELSQLTDRELDDLGISRFQIDSIARDHAVA